MAEIGGLEPPKGRVATAFWGVVEFVDRLVTGRRFAAALILLVVSFWLVHLWSPWGEDAFRPLGDFPDQDVVSEHVEVGGFVQVVGIKCLADGYSHVEVRGDIQWRRIGNGREPIVTARNVLGALPGEGHTLDENNCSERVFLSPVPEGVDPGVWQIEGEQRAINDKGEVTQVVRWRTEPFVVTDAQ